MRTEKIISITSSQVLELLINGKTVYRAGNDPFDIEIEVIDHPKQ